VHCCSLNEITLLSLLLLSVVQVDKSKFADNDFDRQFLLGKTFGGGGGGGGGVGAEDIRSGTA
jgi:hypothetical protein